MQFRRLELFPTLFLVVAVVVSCGLGNWQMERLRWKEGVIAEVDKAAAAPVLTALPQEVAGLTYRHAKLTGIFLYDHTMHFIGRQQGGQVGYNMLTPLALEDGRILLVNRGFSPPGKESRPEGQVTVEGIFRPLRVKRFFAPENNPEKNVWTYEDMDKIGATLGKKPLSLVLEAVGLPNADVFPMPNDGKIVFVNDHLGYAITWYGLALVSVVMFGVYYRKK